MNAREREREREGERESVKVFTRPLLSRAINVARDTFLLDKYHRNRVHATTEIMYEVIFASSYFCVTRSARARIDFSDKSRNRARLLAF